MVCNFWDAGHPVCNSPWIYCSLCRDSQTTLRQRAESSYCRSLDRPETTTTHTTHPGQRDRNSSAYILYLLTARWTGDTHMKRKHPTFFLAPPGDRTRDLPLARRALFHLSHRVCVCVFIHTQHLSSLRSCIGPISRVKLVRCCHTMKARCRHAIIGTSLISHLAQHRYNIGPMLPGVQTDNGIKLGQYFMNHWPNICNTRLPALVHHWPIHSMFAGMIHFW